LLLAVAVVAVEPILASKEMKPMVAAVVAV